MARYLYKLESILFQDVLCGSAFEIDPVVLEKISNVIDVFLLFDIISPWKILWVLDRLSFPSPKDILCQLWMKFDDWCVPFFFQNIILKNQAKDFRIFISKKTVYLGLFSTRTCLIRYIFITAKWLSSFIQFFGKT